MARNPNHFQNTGQNAACPSPGTASPVKVNFHSDGNTVTGTGYCMAVMITKNGC
jgi:hypothetical protein